MLELRHYPLTNVFAFLVIASLVPRQRIQDRHTTPLRTFVQGNKQLAEDSARDLEDVFVRARSDGGVVDVCQCGDRVCNDLLRVSSNY